MRFLLRTISMNEKENKQNRLSEGEKAQIKEAVLKQAEKFNGTIFR